MQYAQNLTANQWQRVDLSGRFFVLEDLGAATSLSLRFDLDDGSSEEVELARRGFKLRLLAGSFQRVHMRSGVGAAVRVIASFNDIDIDFVDGTATNATIVGPLPLPVSNDRGTPGNLLHVAGVSLSDAPAVAISDNAAVAAGPVLAAVAAADATRRAIRVCNLGPDPVAIGGAALTWAKRCVVLQAGDTLLEDRAANLAIFAITDAAKTASVTWQGITA